MEDGAFIEIMILFKRYPFFLIDFGRWLGGYKAKNGVWESWTQKRCAEQRFGVQVGVSRVKKEEALRFFSWGFFCFFLRSNGSEDLFIMSLCFVPSSFGVNRLPLRRNGGREGVDGRRRKFTCARSRSPMDDVEKSFSDLQRDLKKFQKKLNERSSGEGEWIKFVVDSFEESSVATKWGLGALGTGLGTLALMKVVSTAFSIVPMILFPLIVFGAVSTFGMTIAAGVACFVVAIPTMILLGSLQSLLTLIVLGVVGYTGYTLIKPKDDSDKNTS